MSEQNGKVCCNCRHNIRKWQKEYDREICRCYCEVYEIFMAYTDVMTGWCRHWSKDKVGDTNGNS